MKILLILLAILCINCSASGLVDCEGSFGYNPVDFSEEQKQWIAHSAVRWNNWVGYELVSVHPAESILCSINNGKSKNPNAIGTHNSPHHVITIDLDRLEKDNNLNQVRFEQVIMHEMGHALGFNHIMNGPALMGGTPKFVVNDFTELDRIQCINLGYCKTLLPAPSN